MPLSKWFTWATYLIFGLGLFALSVKAFLIFWGIQMGILLALTLWSIIVRDEKKKRLPFMVEGVLSIIVVPIVLAFNPIMYWYYLFAGEYRLAEQCWTFSDELLSFIWDFLHRKKPEHRRV